MQNDFISSQKIKAMFRDCDFEVLTKNILINGQKRGCSGFIVNKTNNKICYLTTEPYFKSGLFGRERNEIMYRTAEHIKDYQGGLNQWCSFRDLKENVKRMLG